VISVRECCSPLSTFTKIRDELCKTRVTVSADTKARMRTNRKKTPKVCNEQADNAGSNNEKMESPMKHPVCVYACVKAQTRLLLLPGLAT
jgi:hypothetical protein